MLMFHFDIHILQCISNALQYLNLPSSEPFFPSLETSGAHKTKTIEIKCQIIFRF